MAVWICAHVLHWSLAPGELESVQRRVGLRPSVVLPALEALGHAPLRDTPRAILDGVVPIVSYWAFHFGVIGTVFNSVFMLALGRRLEARAGWLRFGLFAAACVVSGGLAHVMLDTEPGTALGGSALTAGVIGAYLVWHWRAKVTVFVPVIFVPAFVAVGAPILAVGWAAVQWEPVQRLLTRGIAHPLCYEAILVGAAVGVVGSLLLWPARRKGKR